MKYKGSVDLEAFQNLISQRNLLFQSKNFISKDITCQSSPSKRKDQQTQTENFDQMMEGIMQKTPEFSQSQ